MLVRDRWMVRLVRAWVVRKRLTLRPACRSITQPGTLKSPVYEYEAGVGVGDFTITFVHCARRLSSLAKRLMKCSSTWYQLCKPFDVSVLSRERVRSSFLLTTEVTDFHSSKVPRCIVNTFIAWLMSIKIFSTVERSIHRLNGSLALPTAFCPDYDKYTLTSKDAPSACKNLITTLWIPPGEECTEYGQLHYKYDVMYRWYQHQPFVQ